MGILCWILFGLIAGLIARWLMPGPNPVGLIITTILGIVGALVGGFLGQLIGFGDLSGFDLRSMALAVGGALLLLIGHRMLMKRA